VGSQVLINALVLGCLYACIAIGFSLVWGVLNVINLNPWIVHRSRRLSRLGTVSGAGDPALVCAGDRGAPCFSSSVICCSGCCSTRVITAPVLVTLTLTFGLDLILNNAMIYYFKADYRKLTLSPPMGSISLFDVVVPA